MKKSLGTALRKLQTVLRDGQAPIFVLNMLTRHFRQLWQLRELMARKVPKPEMGRAIGLRSDYFLPGLMKQAGNFTLAEFRELFEQFYETDIALKSSRLKPAFILERLFMAICAGTGCRSSEACDCCYENGHVCRMATFRGTRRQFRIFDPIPGKA